MFTYSIRPNSDMMFKHWYPDLYEEPIRWASLKEEDVQAN